MEMLFELLAAHTTFSLGILGSKDIIASTQLSRQNTVQTDDNTSTKTQKCTPIVQRCLLRSLVCELRTLTIGSLRTLTGTAVEPTDPRTLARKVRLLQDRENARTYEEKHRIDKQLYYHLGFDLKEEAARRESLFDVKLVKEHLSRLETALEVDDPCRLLDLLRTHLTRDLGGICNPALYDRPGAPTEPTIARYQRAVLNALNTIVAACLRNDERIANGHAQRELECIEEKYGNTALCCSGGGTLGMIHIGEIKALRDAGRLPRVISGSSAGAIVCAILCTRTDEELPKILEEFVHGDLAVFVGQDEPPGWLARGKHYLKNGAAFDSSNLERVMKVHLGSMTFQEAHIRTGKELNITVSTSDRNNVSQRVVNRKCAPNVVIWSAVVASCALPFAFKAGYLVIKDPLTKKLFSLDDGAGFIDGSFQGDIPLQRLAEDFNCKYFIVAQTNPHVLIAWHLRRAFGEGTLGKTVEHLSNFAVQELCLVLPGFGEVGRTLAAILDQPYSGDITISPDLTLAGFAKVLSNPTPDFMDAARRAGELTLEPYIPMIKNHVKIERAIAQACADVTQAYHFSGSQSDLRRLHFEHAARSRRRRGSTQSVPEFVPKPLSRNGRNHRRSKTSNAAIQLKPLTTERGAVRQHSTDSSASERRAKFSLESESETEKPKEDDSVTSLTPAQDTTEDDSDSEPETVRLHSHSAPASPTPTLSNLLDGPLRSGVPAVTPMPLLMTPTSERSLSPELRRPVSQDFARCLPPAGQRGRQDSARPTKTAVRATAKPPTTKSRVRRAGPRDQPSARRRSIT